MKYGRLVWLLVFVHLVLFFLIAWFSITYRFDIDAPEDGMLAATARIVAGQPLYGPPSLAFTPYIYTPLFYFAAAGVAKLVGLNYGALRIVSACSTIVCAILIAACGTRETKRLRWGALGAGLFFATFGAAGGFYSLGRSDMLAGAFFLGGLWSARRGWNSASGILLAVCIFAKQSYLLAAVAVLVACWPARDRIARGLAAFAIATGIGIWIANRWSGGWFWFYTYWLPAHHPVDWSGVGSLLLRDVGLLLPALVVIWLAGRKNLPLFYPVCLAGAFVSALSGRVHSGGAANGAIPFYFVLCILFAIGCERLVTLHNRKALAGLLAALQLFILLPLATRILPPEQAFTIDMDLLERLRASDGPCLVFSRSYFPAFVGERPLSGEYAIADVLRGEPGAETLGKEIRESVEEQRYSLIVLDEANGSCARPKLDFLPPDFESRYRLADRITASGHPSFFRRRAINYPACVFVPINLPGNL